MKLALLQPWMVIFLPLLTVRMLSAFYSNISDCDETFNYWEPVRAPHTLARPSPRPVLLRRCSCTRIEVHAARTASAAPLPAARDRFPDLGVLPCARDPLLRLHRPPFPPSHPIHCPCQGICSAAVTMWSWWPGGVAVCGCGLLLCMVLFTVDLGMAVRTHQGTRLALCPNGKWQIACQQMV